MFAGRVKIVSHTTWINTILKYFCVLILFVKRKRISVQNLRTFTVCKQSLKHTKEPVV